MEDLQKPVPELTDFSREDLIDHIFELYEEKAILRIANDGLKNEIDIREKESLVDLQTGLYNSNYFTKKLMPTLQKHVEEERRQTGTIRVFGLADVDNTDKFNEWFGHPGCDTIIEIIAQVISGEVRGVNDVVGRRYSNGDEFYILLNFDNVDIFDVGEGVESIKMRIRKQLEMAFDGHVKISMGFVQVGLCKTAEEVVKEADNLMYQEKRAHKKLAEELPTVEDF